MALSSELLSQFVKVTNDSEKPKIDTILYGTVKRVDGVTYVQLDGAADNCLTPVSSTTSAKDGDRVTVMIKDHTATVTGNITDPSASSNVVTKVNKSVSEFGTVIAHKISTTDLAAINASIDNLLAKTINVDQLNALYGKFQNLQSEFADFDNLDVERLKAIAAEVESIEADFGNFTELDADTINAISAEITNLKGYTAAFVFLSADELEAVKANIKELAARNAKIDDLDANYADIKLANIDLAHIDEAFINQLKTVYADINLANVRFANIDKAFIDELNAKYANVDFANIDFAKIDEATFRSLFANAGIIQYLEGSDGIFTGELIGVTIKGDLIEAGTIKVDRLIVRGSDGKYYALGTDFTALPGVEPVDEDMIHGSVLVEKSIVAEKIRVDDLAAFEARLANFKIDIDPDTGVGRIYNINKPTVDNGTDGVYLDSEGQAAIGNGTSFIKFYKDPETGQYKLDISASSIKLGTSGKTVEETIDDNLKNIKVGARNLVRNSTDLIFSNYCFAEPTLQEIMDEQQAIISACDAITGETTSVVPGEASTTMDLEVALDETIAEQQTIIDGINSLLPEVIFDEYE